METRLGLLGPRIGVWCLELIGILDAVRAATVLGHARGAGSARRLDRERAYAGAILISIGQSSAPR